MNNYLNNHYIINFRLSDNNLNNGFNISKDRVYLFIKFEHKIIHEDILGYDFTLEDLTKDSLIHISKLNPIIKNINYSKIHNYIFENKLNEQDVDTSSFIYDNLETESQRYSKINFEDYVYIRSYPHLFYYAEDINLPLFFEDHE